MPTTQTLTCLPGVGPALARKLAKLGLIQVQDLLFHLPIRYEDQTRIVQIKQIMAPSHALVDGKITFCNIQGGRRSSLIVNLDDGTGSLVLRFFNFHANQRRQFDTHQRMRCFGEIKTGPRGLEMIHPQYYLYDHISPPLEQTLTPVYPATAGISQSRIRQLVNAAFVMLKAETGGIEDLLAPLMNYRYKLPDLLTSLQYLHQPNSGEDTESLAHHHNPARQRLIMEELLAHQLSLLQLKRQDFSSAPVCARETDRANQLLRQLPFSLTGAQAQVWQELSDDLSKACPMVRMVQGDVGSGKTIVAALAACQVVDARCQVAILAPTEILAEQHLHNFQKWLSPLQIRLVWLAGKLKIKPKREALAAIANGQAQVIVGTHALFQDSVNYYNLGLIIIDEQHRFGVAQRHALLQKGKAGTTPHQLVMTATPIPRSLAMTAYADLDHSVINELPPGRKPVNTAVISNRKRDHIIERIANVCAAGRQVYWVCPLIETSEILQCEAAEATAVLLQQQLAKLRIGLMHGRLDSAAKATVMAAFKHGHLDLLVATTIIEVGVDVANANLMIIENAERLGLAQLHQLRGRVGRGTGQSHCILLYQHPLSHSGRERLSTLRDSSDGFEIAEKDLQLRGPGEVLGTRQTGAIILRIADLVRDAELLPEIKILAADCQKKPDLADKLIHRWLGNKSQYGKV